MTRAKSMFAAIAAVAAIATATIASGQDERRPDRGTATVYRDAGYNGPAVTITDENPTMGLVWRVNSIRVQSGRWELCPRVNYRGQCRTVDRDTPLFALRGIQVQSVRRIDHGGWRPPEPPMVQDQTLRGTFAQFHTAPQMGGRRVRACATGAATAACAARAADQFCRSTGWNGSARQHLETVGRDVYLADVLCVRSNY